MQMFEFGEQNPQCPHEHYPVPLRPEEEASGEQAAREWRKQYRDQLIANGRSVYWAVNPTDEDEIEMMLAYAAHIRTQERERCSQAVCDFCAGKVDDVDRVPVYMEKQYICNFGEWAGGFMHKDQWGGHHPCDADGIHRLAAAIREMDITQDVVEFQEIVSKLKKRIAAYRDYVKPSGCFEDQKHLDEGSVERIYWHYGYLVALRDVLQLFGVK